MNSHQTKLTESASSFLKDELMGQEQELHKTLSIYRLRENPKRSSKLQDPHFASSLDRESETEEGLALCLMLLSRDATWKRTKESTKKKIKKKVVSKARRCEKCMKRYRSSQALSTHKKICSLDVTKLRNTNNVSSNKSRKAEGVIFECPYCYKLFASGQALGGHKRSHPVASNYNITNNSSNSGRQVKVIDLNLPASLEDEEFSVVLEA